MRLFGILLSLALVLGMTLAMSVMVHAASGFEAEDHGSVALPASPGSVLTNGNVYCVEQDTTIAGNATAATARERSALIVDSGATVYIYVPSGVTLNVTGADASDGGNGGYGVHYTGNGSETGDNSFIAQGGIGAGAGIFVPADASLYLIGKGKITAAGGKAGKGGNGGDGKQGSYNVNDEYFGQYLSGPGGGGGAGGGGSAAAIGGAGGNGGKGGAIAAAQTAGTMSLAGNNGGNGESGSPGTDCGNINISSSVSVNATNGASSDHGTGGSAGAGASVSNASHTYLLGGGGGGGGGAAGSAENGESGIGGGGAGGAGGGAGGSGGNRSNTDAQLSDLQGEGGNGGQGGGGNGLGTKGNSGGAAGSGGAQASAGNNGTVTQDATAAKTYEISYTAPEGSGTPTSVVAYYTLTKSGQTITTPTFTANKGYQFNGWDLTTYAKSLSGTPADLTQEYSETISPNTKITIPDDAAGSIAFSANVTKLATVPVLEGPDDVEMRQGESGREVSVKVLSPMTGHVLSYLWQESSNGTDFTNIPGNQSNRSSYTIPPDTSEGIHYFRCVVTATRTDNGESTTTTTDPCTVTVANIKYPLWIGDTQVTSENMDNVLGDDTVSFTPAKGTTPAKLTLKGANITKTYNFSGILYTGTDDLMIELESGTDNHVNATGTTFSDAIVFSSGKITITGKGKLTAEGQTRGIYAADDSILTIDGSDVTAKGGGIGIHAKNDLTIKSGTVNASGTNDDGNGIYSSGKISIIDGNITATGKTGAVYTNTAKNLTLGNGITVMAGDNETSAVDVTATFADNHNSYKWVQTKEVTKYPLWIGETQVTSVNKSGKNWSYNPDKRILTLHGKIDGSGEYTDGYANYDYGIRCEIPELTIDVETDSTVEGSGTKTYSCGILAPSSDLTITGSGKLTAKGGSGDTGDGSYGYTSGLYANTINVTGKLEAIGGLSSRGENESRGINASKINVRGELIASGEGYGVVGVKTNDVIVIEEGSKVTITGGIKCINNSVVKTAINGTAWEDVEGTEGATLIKAGNTEHDLSKFKKAVFPTEADPATVTTKPTGKTLTYNGKAQELVTAGKAEGGEMQYAIGKDNKTAPTTGWSTSIPEGTKAGTYYVWYKAVGDDMHIDSKPAFVTSTIKPAPVAVSDTLLAKATAKGKTGMTISWNKIQGADGYDIFFAACNKNGKKVVCKKAKSMMGNKTFKWTKSGLKKGTAYKAYVKAYKMKDGKKTYIKTSPMMHAYTGNGTKKYTNAKSVTVKKAKVSLKKGKTYKIKAKVNKVKKNKKLMPKSHVATLRYLSSDKKVATVSKSGKITAKAKGSCVVYVFAHNGVSKSIKVTVP